MADNSTNFGKLTHWIETLGSMSKSGIKLS